MCILKNKRTILLCKLTLTVMLFITAAVLFSCAPKDAETEKLSDTATTAAASTTAAVTEQPEQPEIITGVRYDNGVLRIIDVNGSGPNGSKWDTYDIYTDVQTGEPINDAVYKRNLFINETFGVKIEEIKVADVQGAVTKSVQANSDDYDVIDTRIVQAANLATSKMLVNIDDIPHLDFEHSWWDQELNQSVTINNKQYFGTGDITVIANDATWVLMFSKKIIEDKNLPDPYKYVSDNDWTVENMYGMMTAAAEDLNGDGKMAYTDDMYGTALSHLSVSGLFYSCGLMLTEKNELDIPVYSLDHEKTENVLKWAYKITVDPNVAFNYKYTTGTAASIQTVFAENRALFYSECMQCVARLRSDEINFGVLPLPKYDKSQEKYRSFVYLAAAMICVPTTNQKLEMTGTVLEAMGWKSQEYLTPAYYDINLISKGLRDEQSEPMIEIILKNRVFDTAYIYNWGNMHESLQQLAYKNADTFASTMTVLERIFSKNMETALKAFTE